MSGKFDVESVLNKHVCEDGDCIYLDECEGRKYYCPAYKKLKEILE
ncbi:MAG: hypothetical protein QXY07_00275 [Candidatus Bathyarchaeia archaeon]